MVLTEQRQAEPGHKVSSHDHESVSPTRQFVARHADGLSVLGVLAISLGSAAWFTRSFYYFQDDFVFIRQAQQSNLSLTYLRETLFQHFSPNSRLADYALAHWFHSSLAVAHITELVLLAVSLLAFSWAIAEVVGRHWWRHLLTLAFAESLVLTHLLVWWTATANILPATIFGLLTIAAFFRYRRVGKRRWIAISLLSYGLSLCSHETSWLIVGYLVLFDVLVLEPGGRLREALVRMWREAWIWAGFALLTLLAMINYFIFYYGTVKPRPTVFEMLEYIGIQFSQAFAPSAIGLRPLTTGWTNTAALVFDSIVFAVIVIVSIYRRPSAWRVWTVFGVGYLANSILIGTNRVGAVGVDFGRELYYLQSPAYLFLLCAGVAFSLDPSGAPYAMREEVSMLPRLPAHVRPTSQRVRLLFLSTIVLGVSLYAIAFIASATAMTAKDGSNVASATARKYFTTLVGQIDVANNHGGQVGVLDAKVPAFAVSASFAPLDHLLYDLPVVSTAAAVDQLRASMFKVTSDGTLVPVRLERVSGMSGGLPVSAITGGAGARPIPATSSGTASHPAVANGSCFSSPRPGGVVEIELGSPVNAPSGWLLVGLRTTSGGSVTVSTLNKGTPTVLGSIYLAPASGPTDYLVPLSRQPFDQVWLSAETGAQDLCVSSVDVGTFHPS